MTLKMTDSKKETKFIPLDKKKQDDDTPKKAKLKSQKKQTSGSKRGVLLLSHIPHGFYEPQMFDFFKQFGEVTRLKLARSRKTGKTRHFAFIEFQFEEVARIVADTMNNYLMFQKILKCKLIPRDQLKPETFKNWQYKHHLPKTRKQAIRRHNTDLVDPVKIEKKNKRLKTRREGLQKKLSEMGIDYDVINVKVNELFVPPERSRASAKDIESLRANVSDMNERCSDFEYSDDEMDAILGKRKDARDEAADLEEETEPPLEKAKGPRGPKTIDISSAKQQEEEFGVMVVDLDDPEITFKTPPASAKIKRRSMTNGSALKSTENNDREVTPGKRKTPKSSLKQKRLQRLKEMEKELDESEEMLSTPARKKPKKVPTTEKKVVKKRAKLNKTM